MFIWLFYIPSTKAIVLKCLLPFKQIPWFSIMQLGQCYSQHLFSLRDRPFVFSLSRLSNLYFPPPLHQAPPCTLPILTYCVIHGRGKRLINAISSKTMSCYKEKTFVNVEIWIRVVSHTMTSQVGMHPAEWKLGLTLIDVIMAGLVINHYRWKDITGHDFVSKYLGSCEISKLMIDVITRRGRKNSPDTAWVELDISLT